MTTSKRIIKYLSIAFAIFLTITIISSITSFLYSLVTTLKDTSNNKNMSEVWQNTNIMVNDLDINLDYNSLNIKVGDKLSIETSSQDIKYLIEDNTLKIEDNKKIKLTNNEKEELTIYIPSNIVLNKINIDMGIGTLNIENISARKLELNLGAGTTTIDNIYSENTNIDTGAGTFTITNGNINNLDLDIGVGKTTINSNITGNSTISAGIGPLSLSLPNNNYTFKVEKGIGKVIINDKEVKDNEIVGTGTNIIKLSGALGDIKVRYEER